MREQTTDERLESEIANEMMHVVRKLYQFSTIYLDSLGIGMGQVPILEVLSENDSLTQRQIANMIRVTPPTLSGSINRLERSGLVQRHADRSDARITRVSLTQKGNEITGNVFDAIKLSHDTVLSGFSSPECEMLLSFMRRMSDNLMKAFEPISGKEEPHDACNLET